MSKYRFFFIFLFFILILPSVARASTLYMEPSEGGYAQGDSFVLDIRIDGVKECVNTIEAEILFPTDYLNVLEFLSGESILSLWVEKPSSADLTEINKAGRLYFAGGIPGGYCGKIPGDPGDSNLVGRLVFKIPGFIVSDAEKEKIEIYFGEKTRILLNDGLGSADSLEKKNANFEVLKDSIIPASDWKNYITEDLIQPEPFVVELHKNPDIFNGSYHIIFSTVDKQSGVDHFEVLEIGPDGVVGIEPKNNWINFLLGKKTQTPNWKVAEMPYLLEDQDLKSIIKVRAIDKAGNIRQVEFIPPQKNTDDKEFSSHSYLFVVLSIVSVLFLLVALAVFIRKRKNVIKQ